MFTANKNTGFETYHIVEILHDCENGSGTFTKGHLFVIVEIRRDRIALRDNDNNRMSVHKNEIRKVSR